MLEALSAGSGSLQVDTLASMAHYPIAGPATTPPAPAAANRDNLNSTSELMAIVAIVRLN